MNQCLLSTERARQSVDGYPFETAVAFAHITSMPNYKFHLLKVPKSFISGQDMSVRTQVVTEVFFFQTAATPSKKV